MGPQYFGARMKNVLTILGHVATYALAGLAIWHDPSVAVPVIVAVGASSVLPSIATTANNVVLGKDSTK